MNDLRPVPKGTYAGLFVVTLATIMHEILLTRIFSVTMWYHFAFMAISVAMFGMTVGAVIVYLLPAFFSREKTHERLVQSAMVFGVSLVASLLAQICVPFMVYNSFLDNIALGFIYIIAAIPFIFSGICICLCLTQFPGRVGKLYGVDLAGSALGCILLIYLLQFVDGPSGVILVAALAAGAGVCFATALRSRAMLALSIIVVALITTAGLVNAYKFKKNYFPPVRLTWVKGALEQAPLYQKWNSFSRVRVEGNPDVPSYPFGWGYGSALPPDTRVKQLYLTIDAGAGTMMTRFSGSTTEVEYLKYDIVNLGHYIRPNSDVLVVGVGGGRDILSALVFNQKSVRGVEINDNILDALNNKFGDFTGHLNKIPNVKMVNDEARSYITRQNKKFDILQVSLIDTWAATAAGAYVLSENSLYTIEAWKTFLSRMNPNGIVTFSRWYYRDRPAEVYRLVNLAANALRESGVKDPRQNIMLARLMLNYGTGDTPDGIGTILVSKDPFSRQDIETFESTAKQLGYEVVLTPITSKNDDLVKLCSDGHEQFAANYPLRIDPPTDNNPFFFHTLRLRHALNTRLHEQGMESFNAKAVYLLAMLLFTVTALSIICIMVPLYVRTRRAAQGIHKWPLLIYFACLGLAFMLIEISQMQRLIVFLGHPTYGLSVVLFSLLLSSSIGSWLSQRAGTSESRMPAIMLLTALIVVVVIFGVLTPVATQAFAGERTTQRIAIAVGILFPLGITMGFGFPLGMSLAQQRNPELSALLWGTNGATSVVASVLAVAISISIGISATFWVGFGCYVVALLMYGIASRGGVSATKEVVKELQTV